MNDIIIVLLIIFIAIVCLFIINIIANKFKIAERWGDFWERNRIRCNWLENESEGKTPEEIEKLEQTEEDYFFNTGGKL
jgi:hypothetical protein